MKPLKKSASRQLAAYFLCLCAAATVPFAAADTATIAGMINSADLLRQEAAAVNNEWRYTGKWIKQARAALESGDLTTAKKLAEKAKFEAERALEQATISKTTWIIAVPK